ncbi:MULTISPECIES: hypothetical protein [Streptomyces]|uniref:Uncharacterized protein n=1 Tax=Streptomyces xanthii TaxID=2768069 RepID=A0A7H1B284_9ACTN|nr:hypothetical protein [Streptomyces xanthii]QNS02839.1 hypothetical protein IAG42_03840 [Streptomyces xanthii]
MTAGAADDGRLVSAIEAGPGGAMTDEVGVITGDVTLATVPVADGLARVEIQYTDADEWYTLTGSPVPVPPDGLAALHERLVERVESGGAAQA